jgi:hypothetical protein
MSLAEELKRYEAEFVAVASETPFIVFLCGPNLTAKKSSAKFRVRIKERLEQEGFEVILGEDDGLDNPRLRKIGINAQDNEVEFIRRSCNAVIIIADSVGAFCELGLFSWHFVHRDGVFKKEKKSPDVDCILLLQKKYRNDKSYLNQGPAAAVNGFGKVEFVDFSAYDGGSVIERLRSRRGVSTVDNRRGRPRKITP